MRLLAAIFLSIMILFTGCAVSDAPIEKALALRSKIENSNGCAFHTTITADYGEKIYNFSMDCQTDKEGNLTFSVTKPETIAGITGKITTAGGAITFDDQVLAFQTIADGLVTPVSAPWVLIKTIKGGYIKGCAETENGLEISADDSYADNSLHLEINVKENLPISGEIFWNGRRVLTLSVEDFRYL